MRVTPSLPSTSVTSRHHYYGGVRPWMVHRYFRPRVFALVPFPLASPARFSSSVRKPGLESRSLYTGHHMDSRQVSSMLLSRDKDTAPVLMSSKVVSMRRQEFACARLSNPYMTRSQPRLFHNVHHRDLATEAAYGCLEPPPAGRLRRAYLHLSYSMALACLHDTISSQTPSGGGLRADPGQKHDPGEGHTRQKGLTQTGPLQKLS
jgi:hypothetical protein